jgi:hypothetical protein
MILYIANSVFRLMRVLLASEFSCFFVIPANHKWSVICVLIKVDWLSACNSLSSWHCIGCFPPALA